MQLNTEDPLGILGKSDPLGILKKKDGGVTPPAGPSPAALQRLEELRKQLKGNQLNPQRTELPRELKQAQVRAESIKTKEEVTPKVTPVMFSKTPTFKVEYPEQDELTAKVLGFQSAQQRVQFQEEDKQKKQENAQKAADEFYKTGVGKLYFNFFQPIAESGARAIGNTGATVSRLVGEDKLADAIVDRFTPEKRYEGTIAGNKPTKLQGGLFNDGKINYSKLPSSFVRGLTDMAWLIAPAGGVSKVGQAAGLSQKAATGTGLIANSFLQSREDYYQEGKASGLKGDSLDNFATGAAGLTSALEAVFPNTIAMGGFKSKMAKEYAKQIANGITAKAALKAGAKEVLKEAFVKENIQELTQLAGDKVARTLTDMTTGEDNFGDQFDWDKSKDEIYETLVITPVVSLFAAGSGAIRNYTPTNYEKALFYDASKNAQQVNQFLDNKFIEKEITEDQYKQAKQKFASYNTALEQVKSLGYSEDQTLQMAWELFSGKEKLPVNQSVVADPILKDALGTEIKKDKETISENIKSIGMGIPSVGSDIEGKELSFVISNIGDKGAEIGQGLVDQIGDDTYRVEEVSVKDIYDNNPEFRSYVESYKKGSINTEAMLVPAVLKDNSIVDGRARLAEQYLAGKDRVKIFKNISNAINQSEVEVAGTESNIIQPQGVNQGQPEVGQGTGQQGQATQPQANVSDSNISGQGTVISLAPFFDTTIKTAEDAKALRQTPEYKAYIDSIPTVAKVFGLNVLDISDTIGGFENAQKKKIVEISNRVFVDNANLEQVEKFAAIMGTMTPETQEATIAAKFISEQETVPANEYVEQLTIKVGDVDKSIESLQEAGIYDFTIDESAGTVSFLDFSQGTDAEFDTKIANFERALQNRNIQYEEAGRSPVQSKYIDPARRTELIAALESDAAGLQQGGESFRSIIAQAKQRDKAFRGELAEELRQDLVSDPISKAEQTLKSTGVSIDLVEDPAEYDRMVEQLGGQRGTEGVFLSKEGKILLNKSKLNDAITAGRIVWHESSHPVINIIRNTNPELYNRVISGMKSSDNPAVQQAIAWANQNYQGEGVIDDESIVEAIAMVADGTLDLNQVSTGLKQSIIDFINLIARAFNLGQVRDTDVQEFKNLASQIADALTSGRDIAQVVGQENVSSFSAERLQERGTQSDNNPAFFENIKDFANQSSFANKVAFKEAVQEKLKSFIPELKKIYGKKFDPSVYNEETKKYLSDVLTKEASNAISAHPEAIGWYDEKTQSALAAISAIHPEIATDMEARGAFILPLAVMSNGNKVDKNFDYAEEQYRIYKETGRYNPDGDFGAQQVGIKKSLKLINDLLDNGVTMSEVSNFLTSKHKAGDLKYRKPSGKLESLVSGELATEDVYGAVILGPKIGNGFYMNLWGEFDQLTMDRWFMRTWGRLTGTLIERDKDLISNGKKRIASAIQDIKSDKEALKILKSAIGSVSGRSATDIANAIEKVSAKKDVRNLLSSNEKTDEIRKAGNGLAKLLRGEKEAPSSGEERRFIREVFSDVQRRLSEESGVDITMADLQAVMWYPEKILYESFKEGESFEDASEGYTEDSAPDYFNAAKKIAKKLGATDEQINQAVSEGRRYSAERTGGRDSVTGETIGRNDQEVLGRIRQLKGGSPELTKRSRPQASVGNRLAPNGKPSKLNEVQYAQVRTPEFKNWFGDWENDPSNASKVVDENGEPRVVYHGTNNTFDKFEKEKLGSKNWMADSAFMGFFFAGDRKTSEAYTGMNSLDMAGVSFGQYDDIINKYKPELDKAQNDINEVYGRIRREESERRNTAMRSELEKNRKTLLDGGLDNDTISEFFNSVINSRVDYESINALAEKELEEGGYRDRLQAVNKKVYAEIEDAWRKKTGANPQVMELFLNIKNPLVVDYKDITETNLPGNIQEAIGTGKDGVIFNNLKDGAEADDIFVALEPNQIKSATTNVGTFSTTDNRIQASVGNRPENNANFKLAAFVMRKKAEGATDGEIAIAIASVTGMKPEDIKTLIDNPEQYIRDKFPSMSKLQQDNLIQKAKIQNIYRGRQFGKPIDKAFTGLEVPKEKIDEYMRKTAGADNFVKQWASDFQKNWLDPAKGLPSWVLAIKDFASGTKNIEISRAAKTIERLKAEAKKIGFEDWNAFSKALVVAKDVKRFIPNEGGIVPFDAGVAAAGRMFTTQDDQLPALVPEEIKALPEEIIPYVYAMRGQIDNLTRDLIGYGYVTPEQAVTLENNIGQYVNRSYRMYNEMRYKPEKETYNAAVKFLADEYIKQIATDKAGVVSYEEVQNEAIEKAKKDVEAILNKKKNPYFNASTDRRNTGILEQRKDIPEPIRKLMGEYTDPGTVFMMTVAKQAALKASSEYLTKLRESGMGTLFFEENDPSRPASHSVQIASTGTESMSPLGGLFTTPEIAEALETVEPTYNELTNTWMKLVGAVRWGKTVGSIATQLKNFESNLGFAVLNGMLLSGKNTKAFGAAGKYVKGQYSAKEIDDITEKTIKLNLVGQSVGMRELKTMLGSGDMNDIALDIALSPDGKWGKKVAKNLNVFREANKLYRLGDDFWKVYAYINEREQLSDARFGQAYDQLTPEQQEQIDVESSERVKSTWPTYDRVVEAAKFVSKRAPIFGNFISFQAESLRVLANSIKIAKEDLKDPKTAHLGVRRIAGITAYFGLRSAITIGLAKLTGFAAAGILGSAFGDDEEERNKKAMQEALPTFMRTGELFVKRTKDPHRFVVVNGSSLDPYAIIPNSLNAFTEGREGIFKKTMDPGVGAATAELFSAFLEPEMTFQTMWSVMNNIDPKTKKDIVVSTDTDAQVFAKVAGKVWDQLEPSSVAMVQRLVERKDKEAELLAIIGARPYDVDLHKSFGYILSQFGRDVDAINSEYNRIKFKELPQADKDAAEKAAEDKKAFAISKVNEIYRNFINLGADPKVLDDLINQRSSIKVTGFDKSTKKFLRTGDIKREKLFK